MITEQFIIGNTFILLGLHVFSISIRTNLCIKELEYDVTISVPFFEEEKIFEIQNQILLYLEKNPYKV